MKYSIIVLICIALASFNIPEVPLQIEVTNIRNNKGQLILSFFTDNTSFKEYEPFLEKSYSKTDVLNGTLNITANLPEGTYGIALIDDENNDGEMEFNFIGLPREGFGFSNYNHKGLFKPKLSAFDFVHNSNNKVEIRVTYW